MSQPPSASIVLNELAQTCAFFADAVATAEDAVHVAHVDEAARCIHLAAYPRSDHFPDLPIPDILRDAAELGSAGLVLAHRQDDPAPGGQASDWSATRQLAEAADLIQVTLLDHLVFHGRDCLSLRRLGLL